MDVKGKISLLPEYLANRIAAGEVVQRPESVVKELVENSIDAGATEIAITIKKSGKELIHIVDNGSGMAYDDLSISTLRHTTSKIKSGEDLERISSFGFRGEALASISSVSMLEIRSSTNDSGIGYCLQSEPQKDIVIEECNCPKGTQIFVKNLFYNVPARKKFLKSDLSEFRHISETLMKIALSNPSIRITFFDNSSLVFDAKAGDMLNRLSLFIDGDKFNQIIPIEYSANRINISGWIAHPDMELAKLNYFFLNGRWINSKLLHHAVSSAYGDLILKNVPFYLINIKCDPIDFDINIHPQKHEVKFENEKHIYNSIFNAVSHSLAQISSIPNFNSESVRAMMPISNQSSSGGNVVVNTQTGEILSQLPSYPKESYSKGSNYISGNNYKKHDFDLSHLSNHSNLISNLVATTTKRDYIKWGESIVLVNDNLLTVYNYKQIKDLCLNSSNRKQLLFPIEVLVGSNIKYLENILSVNNFGVGVIGEILKIYSIPSYLDESLYIDELKRLIIKMDKMDTVEYYQFEKMIKDWLGKGIGDDAVAKFILTSKIEEIRESIEYSISQDEIKLSIV